MLTHSTYEEVLAQARLLSLEDEARLLEELMADLRKRIESQQKPAKARRSILEFEGMDQESWKGVDVQEYIDEGRRDSWDG